MCQLFLEGLRITGPSRLWAECGLWAGAVGGAVGGARARPLTQPGMLPAALHLFQQKESFPEQHQRLSLGCPVLDQFLGGGLPLEGITGLAGCSSAGKTQLALQLCLAVQFPRQYGGLEAGKWLPFLKGGEAGSEAGRAGPWPALRAAFLSGSQWLSLEWFPLYVFLLPEE